ncbi:Uncharacterized protein HZ326_29580 [Fusarium oxysporum f. sp. albedinis]|nr:Uncharacterized protein HZ326_29580 [Fusarium oxysporum f. sp. albedinis]
MYDGKSPSSVDCYKELPYRLGKYLTNFRYRRDLDESWDRRHGLREDGMIGLDRRCGPRREFQSFNFTMVAWVESDALCVPVDAGAADCEVAGAGAGLASSGGTC